MKGYCVDVRGFSLEKKNLVNKAIGELTGLKYCPDENVVNVADKIVNVGSLQGVPLCRVASIGGDMTPPQKMHEISFNDLMLEAGFNYEENGVESFKCIDWSERAVTGNKPAPSEARPRITREQYDAVMAQSDKRTFTKALDDLLAIEKEQLLDESAVRIKQLEREVEYWRKSWVKIDGLNYEHRRTIEKNKRTSAMLSLLLISLLAGILAVIFLGG